ncbi:MAG: PEP-CTERM sorting domain-containing protein [Alphaproteobacteria bacterium]|nr:PEP-CTERM sorting domain-containing protein [Alphaproteobacteria bacterium]
MLITSAATVNKAQELPPAPLSLGAYTAALSTTAPEPASLALFGTALLGLALRCRRA